MFIGHILHKTFLISMFIVCAIAVVLFAKQKVDASLISEAPNAGASILNTVSIAGKCSEINGTTVTSKPADNLCKSGTHSAVTANETGWTWKCIGSTYSTYDACKVIKRIVPAYENLPTLQNSAKPEDKPAIDVGEKDVPIIPDAKPEVIPEPEIVLEPGTAGRDAVLTNTDANVVSDAASDVSTESVEVKQETQTKDGTRQDTKKTNKQKSKADSAPEKLEIKNNNATPGTNQQRQVENHNSEENSSPGTIIIEKSQIITQPIVIEAKQLAKNNNPKISGAVDKTLKVENVVLEKKDNGKNNVRLAGKAEPDAIVSIYIFSNDPIVITVRADAEGNWNYELDKELANGQHEAYVAVADDAGKIISKSEPIAFVKTAQAATVIPVSELTDNLSPIEKSSQQYILIAIVMMSISLAIALILMGYLTHKRNLNEGSA